MQVITTKLKSAQLIISILQNKLNSKVIEPITSKKSATCLNSNNWKQVPANKIRTTKTTTVKQLQHQPIPTAINLYSLLRNVTKEDDNTTIHKANSSSVSPANKVTKIKANQPKRKGKSGNEKVHKVLILGDSHVRGCAAEVKQKLKSEYEVIGFTNPGSAMKDIKAMAKSKMAQLTKKDVVVLWGGSNDVAQNNSIVGLRHILDLVINSSHTNVILMNVPHRHDLMKESCVNKEVETFNKKLRNKMESFKKVELIEVNSERDLYTRHGQHFNSRGKETIASKIALTIENVVKRRVDPITIQWYGEEEPDNQKLQAETTQASAFFSSTTTDVTHTATNDPVDEEEEEKHSEPPNDRTSLVGNVETLLPAELSQTNLSNSISESLPRVSNRNKRVPTTMTKDFLW
jgi:hypothetical protein